MFSTLLALVLTTQSAPQVPAAGTAPSALPVQAPAAAAPAAYVPERVYDTRRKAFVDFEVMLADLARADVIAVGEQHDDPNTHRLEAAVLDGLTRRKVPLTVSLEMFERDVQGTLDAYLAGSIGEEEFVKASRPWPRYATDYRALVEMAKARGWSVIASNVPRRIASAVAKAGKPALETLPEGDRVLAARDLQCPRDAYFERFAATMGGHPAPGQDAKTGEELTERYYWSQCVKDETMAESIAAAFEKQAGAPGTIVHYNGAFHSDFGLGTAERVRRRLPGRRVAVVSMLPVADLDALTPSDEDLKRADFLVYTVR
jgi:uncharacterized iron-regulated protein